MWIWILIWFSLFIGACSFIIGTGIKSLNELENKRHDALMAKLGELENILSKIEYGESSNYKNILDIYNNVQTIKNELNSKNKQKL